MLRQSAALPDDPTSIDWSPNGKLLATGDRNATISIFDAVSLELIDKLYSGVT